MRDEQKRARRQAILDAAWRLFQATGYEAVTVASVAAAAGLAKGTVYLYFPTKEALFLAVQEDQLAGWFDELDARLTSAGPLAADTAAHLIHAGLAARPGLTRLLAILHTVLEQDIDLPTALAFKRWLLARLARTGALLEASLPGLPPGGGAHLLLRCQALVIGLRHLADPAPVVREALREPDLAGFIIDFDREFVAALTALLLGLERAAAGQGEGP